MANGLDDLTEISPADIADAEAELEDNDDLLIAAFIVFTSIDWNTAQAEWIGKDLAQEIAALDQLSDTVYQDLLDLLAGDAGIDDMATLLRRMHIQSMSLGMGGFGNLTPAQLDQLSAFLDREFGFLNNTLGEFDDELFSEAEMNRRLRLYADHNQTTFFTGRTAAKTIAGFTEERRVLMPAEHCSGCVSLAALDWQPIGSMPEPGDGSTPCGNNDKCIKEYR